MGDDTFRRVYDAKVELDERGVPKNARDREIYTVQSCFRTIGKSGPFAIRPPMEVIFARYFGADFIVDYASS